MRISPTIHPMACWGSLWQPAGEVKAYHSLLATSLYFRTITIIGFDEQAQTIFRRLRTQGIRIGTQDLRIAAITLSQGATLMTHNVRDFATISSLNLADWSLPQKDVP